MVALGPKFFPVVANLLSSRLLVSSCSIHLLPPHSPAEKSLQEHMRGRGHMRNLDRLRLAEKSVFVRGFASETTSSDLQSLLEKEVGKVASVWVSDKVSMCKPRPLTNWLTSVIFQAQYAMVEFSDPGDALKALKLSGLQVEGKKLVIKPRRLEVPKKEKKALDSSEDSSLSTVEKLSQCGVNVSEERMKQIPEVGLLVVKFLCDLC